MGPETSDCTDAPEQSLAAMATIENTTLTGEVRAGVSFAEPKAGSIVCKDIDLHGYHPDDICGGALAKIIAQTWEMGAVAVRLIHGHGHNRGRSVGFVNTNTGYFGLRIRSELRHNTGLRRWIKHTTIDCGHDGSTVVKLKTNPSPTRQHFDEDTFPSRSIEMRRGRVFA